MPPILVDNITYVTKIDHSYDVKVQFFVWRVATGVQMSLRNSGDLSSYFELQLTAIYSLEEFPSWVL